MRERKDGAIVFEDSDRVVEFFIQLFSDRESSLSLSELTSPWQILELTDEQGRVLFVRLDEGLCLEPFVNYRGGC